MTTQTNSILFIDTTVANYQDLIAGTNPDTQVVVLDPTKDGITQVTDTLQGKIFASVHIVSHGSEGNLQLGSSQLNTENIEAYSNQLQQWQTALTDNADILLYGCDVAAGNGQNFIQKLSELTNADVAASDDLTGSVAKGGDWALEVATGVIETPLAFQMAVMQAYSDVLATYEVTNTNPSGAGSLRQAIIDANANPGADTIDFSPLADNAIIELPGTEFTVGANDILPDITSDITFTGDNQTVTIKGAGNNPSFFIESGNVNFSNFNISGGDTNRIFFVKGGTVNFNNMTISKGNATGGSSRYGGGGAGLGGALFVYDGTVTVNNVTFANNRAQGGNSNVNSGSYGGGGMGGSTSGSAFGGGGFGGGVSSGDNQGFGGHFSSGGRARCTTTHTPATITT